MFSDPELKKKKIKYSFAAVVKFWRNTSAHQQACHEKSTPEIVNLTFSY